MTGSSVKQQKEILFSSAISSYIININNLNAGVEYIVFRKKEKKKWNPISLLFSNNIFGQER